MIVMINIGWNPHDETYFLQLQLEPRGGTVGSRGILHFTGTLDALLELVKLISFHLQREEEG